MTIPLQIVWYVYATKRCSIISFGIDLGWKKTNGEGKKCRHMKSGEICRNLMKSDEIMISSDFIRFHQISFFYIFLNQSIVPESV